MKKLNVILVEKGNNHPLEKYLGENDQEVFITDSENPSRFWIANQLFDTTGLYYFYVDEATYKDLISDSETM